MPPRVHRWRRSCRSTPNPLKKPEPAPLFPSLGGGLGKPDWLCLEEVSTPIVPPALERRWSNCWHRSNRKQLGISKVSTSTGCRWTTAKFIYWNDLSSFVSFSPGLRYARRYPGYSISSIPAKGEANHPIPLPFCSSSHPIPQNPLLHTSRQV